MTPARIHGLYVIVDPAACRGRSPVDVARLAIDGGARVMQWRDKMRDKAPQLRDLEAIAALCRAAGVPLIVNDHADLAVAAGADGVHLGQTDLPVDHVRRIVGKAAIIGMSTNDAEEAAAAETAGADYVAVGAIFATGTKEVTRPADVARITQVKATVTVPVVAIGGIYAENVAEVAAAGADAAAVISAVCAADDPRAAARELAAAFER